MTNWNDPDLELSEGLASVKLIHVVAGLYLWEFVLNLDYEYSIITKKRQITWSVPLYLTCRWCTLLATILYLLNLNTSDKMNCEAWVIATFVFVYAAYQSASFLIILRIFALWERKRVVVVLTLTFWLTNTAAYIYDTATSHSSSNGTLCVLDDILKNRIPLLSLLVTDIVLTILMLFGVLHWKTAHLRGGIWGLMYTQGLIYVAIATLAYIPNMTFLFLNLNGVMDEIFMVPSMTIMFIGALRMYRGLVDSVVIRGTLDGLVDTTRPLDGLVNTTRPIPPTISNSSCEHSN